MRGLHWFGGSRPLWPAFSMGLLVVLSEILPASWLTGMNAYLVGLAIAVAIAGGRVIDYSLVRALAPFGVLLLLGTVSGIGADSWDFLRDTWYVGNAALTFATGYVLYCANANLRHGLRAIVVAGSLVAISQIAPFIWDPSLLTLNSTQIRGVLGTGFYVPALGLTVLIAFRGWWSEELGIRPIFAWLAAALMAAAIVLTFSRTILLVALVGIVVGLGLLDRRAVMRGMWAAAVGAAALLALGALVEIDSFASQQTFTGKLVRSIEELWVTEHTDFKSINENWRGYETARALRQFASGSPLEWLIGQGFGAMVDLGVAINLGGSRADRVMIYREIPLLHNGYAYLLVKCGAVGLMAFIAFLLLLYRAADTGDRPDAGGSASRLMRAVVVSLFASTWVISGPFNKSDMFGFMLVAGFVYAHLRGAARIGPRARSAYDRDPHRGVPS
jgi:hypothetical protein